MYKYLVVSIAMIVLSGSACFSTSTEPDVAEKESNTSRPEPRIEEPIDETKPDTEEAPEPKSEDAKASREQIESKNAASNGLGPTDTLRAFNDAVIKKDAAKIKSFMSRASIKMISDDAKTQGRSIDDILTAEDGAPMPVEREMQNEKIDGNNATVDVKNSVLGSFETMFLVKEDGNWRVALNKIRDDMIRRMNEMQKNAPPVLK